MEDIQGWIAMVAAIAATAIGIIGLRFHWKQMQPPDPILTFTIFEPKPQQRGWRKADVFIRNRQDVPLVLQSIEVRRPKGARLLPLSVVEIPDGFGNMLPDGKIEAVTGERILELTNARISPEGSGRTSSFGRVATDRHLAEFLLFVPPSNSESTVSILVRIRCDSQAKRRYAIPISTTAKSQMNGVTS